jgi:tetratricopeptide (TPR) repeat protein
MLYYDWPSAARHFRRALALNPSTYVRLTYSGWHLVPLGRAKDAVLETGRIVADEPLNLIGRWGYGATLFFARDFDRAAEEWSRLLDFEPSFSKALQALSVARGMQGKFEEGISLAQKLVEILGHTVHSLWALAQAYAVAGETEAARRVLRDLEELPGSAGGLRHRWRWSMACLVKPTGRSLVWKRRTVIGNPSFCSPTCNPEWIAFDRTRAFTTCWQG